MKHRFFLIIGILVLVSCQQQDTRAEHKPILDDYLEVWNTGNLDMLDGIIDPQFIISGGSITRSTGLDSLKNIIASNREVFPDFHLEEVNLIIEGDLAVSEWVFTGTHSGVGEPAQKGKQVRFPGTSIFWMKDGKILEERIYSNQLVMLMQLGYTVLPPSGADE